MRVVSLLPSATELLCHIPGGAEMLVGRSHECDWPPQIQHLPTLTRQRTTATSSESIDAEVRANLGDNDSLYVLDTDALIELRPDLIITQDLCHVCSIDLQSVQRVAAALPHSPEILSLNPHTIEEVLDDLLRVGAACGLDHDAQQAVVALRARWWSARDHVNQLVSGPVTLLLEWMKPLFIAGHWTPELIEQAGGRHVLNAPGAASTTIEPNALVEAAPERLIIAPCGYDIPAIERELTTLTDAPWWNDLPAVRSGHVAMVDGSAWFNRPGPRLVDAFLWLVAWINDRPELAPESAPVRMIAAARG